MLKSLALAGAGALVVLLAVGLGLMNATLVLEGEVATATVQASQYKRSVLSAELPDGPHRFEVEGLNQVLEVGSTVEVLYLPEDPDRFSLSSTRSLWGTPVAIGSLGSLFLLFGVIGLEQD